MDVLFAINLLIDGALLLTTAWVRGIRPRPLRIVAAALIGASYVVMMFVPALSFLYTLAVKFLLSIIMLLTAFGFVSLQRMLRNVAAFYGVNFAAAGGVLGISYLIQSTGNVWSGIWFSRTGGVGFELGMGIAAVLVSILLSLWLYRMVGNARKRQSQLQAQLAKVVVVFDGKSKGCMGLVDTGNQLCDPLTRTPVMVMEARLWLDELPKSWHAAIEASQADRIVAGIGVETCGLQERLRLIPYRGVNRGTQFMLAIKPDKVHIEMDGTNYESAKVLIGLDGGTLAAEGAYQAIIHPELVNSEAAMPATVIGDRLGGNVQC